MKLCLLVCLVLAAGCGRKTAPTTPEAAAPPSAAGASAPAVSASADGAPAGPADLSKTLDRLTQAVRKFSAENRRVPASLNELVAAGYLAEIPSAPAGKKFAIDDQLRVVVR